MLKLKRLISQNIWFFSKCKNNFYTEKNTISTPTITLIPVSHFQWHHDSHQSSLKPILSLPNPWKQTNGFGFFDNLIYHSVCCCHISLSTQFYQPKEFLAENRGAPSWKTPTVALVFSQSQLCALVTSWGTWEPAK